jgi:hypothetical protein
VNTILHPATLFPVGERWRSTIRSLNVSAEGSRVVAPDDSDNLSAMPSSLPVTRSQHISQLPSFPESAIRSFALRSSGFPNPLRTSSPPPSPDLLDHIVLADGGRARRRKYCLLCSEHGYHDDISLDIFAQENGPTPMEARQRCLCL